MSSEIKTLSNGRKYRLTYTEKPYLQNEYSSGGIKVCAWEPKLNKGQGLWVYIDNFRDAETVNSFLAKMERQKS